MGRVQPVGLLEEPEGVLEVEAAQERLPEPVHLAGGHLGGRAPQPHRCGVPVTGQPVDVESDDAAGDDR